MTDHPPDLGLAARRDELTDTVQEAVSLALTGADDDRTRDRISSLLSTCCTSSRDAFATAFGMAAGLAHLLPPCQCPEHDGRPHLAAEVVVLPGFTPDPDDVAVTTTMAALIDHAPDEAAEAHEKWLMLDSPELAVGVVVELFKLTVTLARAAAARDMAERARRQ